MILQNKELKKEFKCLDIASEVANRSTIVRKSNVRVCSYLYQHCFKSYILITCTSDAGNCNERKLSIMLSSEYEFLWSHSDLNFVMELFLSLFSDKNFKEDFYGKFSNQQFPRLVEILKWLDKESYFKKDLEYYVYLSEGYKVEDTFINLEDYIYGDNK
jgi:hypothetical protein